MGLNPAVLNEVIGLGRFAPVTETGIFSYLAKLIPEEIPSLKSSSATTSSLGTYVSCVFPSSSVHCLVCSSSVQSITLCPSFLHLLQTSGSGQSAVPWPSLRQLKHFSGSGHSATWCPSFLHLLQVSGSGHSATICPSLRHLAFLRLRALRHLVPLLPAPPAGLRLGTFGHHMPLLAAPSISQAPGTPPPGAPPSCTSCRSPARDIRPPYAPPCGTFCRPPALDSRKPYGPPCGSSCTCCPHLRLWTVGSHMALLAAVPALVVPTSSSGTLPGHMSILSTLATTAPTSTSPTPTWTFPGHVSILPAFEATLAPSPSSLLGRSCGSSPRAPTVIISPSVVSHGELDALKTLQNNVGQIDTLSPSKLLQPYLGTI